MSTPEIDCTSDSDWRPLASNTTLGAHGPLLANPSEMNAEFVKKTWQCPDIQAVMLGSEIVTFVANADAELEVLRFLVNQFTPFTVLLHPRDAPLTTPQ